MHWSQHWYSMPLRSFLAESKIVEVVLSFNLCFCQVSFVAIMQCSWNHPQPLTVNKTIPNHLQTFHYKTIPNHLQTFYYTYKSNKFIISSSYRCIWNPTSEPDIKLSMLALVSTGHGRQSWHLPPVWKLGLKPNISGKTWSRYLNYD